jgi:hypothetical protein
MTWQQLPMTIALVLPLSLTTFATTVYALNVDISINNITLKMQVPNNETIPYFHANNREIVIHPDEQHENNTG